MFRDTTMPRDVTEWRRGDLNPHVPRRTLGPQPRFPELADPLIPAFSLVSGLIRVS
jgi:hypothetical protein